MYSPNPVQIEMAQLHSPTKQTPMLSAQPYPQFDEDEQSRINRVTGNIIWYISIVITTAAIPFINLLLFFFQPFELARGINPQNFSIDNLGRLDDFTYFYIVMGVYGGIILQFVVYSCFFSSPCERLKLYVMVDNIMICMLAADVAYAALHIVCFTATYSTDEEYNLQTEFVIYWQDCAVLTLYCLTNFAFTGIFRVLMVNVYWRSWQTIIYKLAIVISSLAYIAVGLIYIFGLDTLSTQVNAFNTEIDPIIDICYASNDTELFSIIPYLQREETSLGDAKNTINSFIIFYVFTNFAFSFEIIAKLTDFDGTADLKTAYQLEEEQAK